MTLRDMRQKSFALRSPVRGPSGRTFLPASLRHLRGCEGVRRASHPASAREWFSQRSRHVREAKSHALRFRRAFERHLVPDPTIQIPQHRDDGSPTTRRICMPKPRGHSPPCRISAATACRRRSAQGAHRRPRAQSQAVRYSRSHDTTYQSLHRFGQFTEERSRAMRLFRADQRCIIERIARTHAYEQRPPRRFPPIERNASIRVCTDFRLWRAGRQAADETHRGLISVSTHRLRTVTIPARFVAIEHERLQFGTERASECRRRIGRRNGGVTHRRHAIARAIGRRGSNERDCESDHGPTGSPAMPSPSTSRRMPYS